MFPTISHLTGTAGVTAQQAAVVLSAKTSEGARLCCDCVYSKRLRAQTVCRCVHPSREFADGVLFAGAPACAAFVSRNGTHHLYTDDSHSFAVVHSG